jgi:hypothetical protein
MLHWTLLPLADAPEKMCIPPKSDPTKETALISGWNRWHWQLCVCHA